VEALETERMVLRETEMADVDDLLDIFSDPEAMRHYPGVKDREEAVAWVRSNQEGCRKHGFGLQTAILKESWEFAGQCGPVVQSIEGRREEVEIGCLFLRKF